MIAAEPEITCDLDDVMQVALMTGNVPPRRGMEEIPALRNRNILRDADYFESSRVAYAARGWFTKRYGFAVPCAEAVAEIASCGPILEVGAGTGCWSKILSHHTEIVATDIAAGESSYGQPVGDLYPVQAMRATTAVKRHPGRTVLMVWPNYDDGWAHRAAQAMQSGTLLCYIGEGAGGCTGDDRFHRSLARDFDAVRYVGIPQFHGLHDGLHVYRKG